VSCQHGGSGESLFWAYFFAIIMYRVSYLTEYGQLAIYDLCTVKLGFWVATKRPFFSKSLNFQTELAFFSHLQYIITTFKQINPKEMT
jgi:cellulose synthase/poly-beta-1,6-N-acetylglucosamine synthase-like glycosyltransferase